MNKLLLKVAKFYRRLYGGVTDLPPTILFILFYLPDNNYKKQRKRKEKKKWRGGLTEAIRAYESQLGRLELRVRAV